MERAERTDFKSQFTFSGAFQLKFSPISSTKQHASQNARQLWLKGPVLSDRIQLSRRAFVILPFALAACKPGREVIAVNGATMGTNYNVVVVPKTASPTESKIRKAINDALAQVNGAMSNWDANSEISRFNAHQGTEEVPISKELAEVMQASEMVHHASDGRFDTTMGPLIETWGFGAPGKRSMPNEVQIETAKVRSGHSNTLHVDSRSISKKLNSAQVNLAAIGKGYGADHIARALEDIGITDYMVEIGGDLYASGRNQNNKSWQIGIETPEASDRTVLEVIGVSNLGMASSGDYRNYFERDGKRCSHVIDPVTGHPITHKTAAATVLADNAMLADAWATAMLTLGRDRGMEIAEQQGIAVMFVDRDASMTQLQFNATVSEKFKALTA